MSRVSLIEQLYTPKKKSALEFNYDNLWAPPIRFFLSQQDINELYKIATSLKYNDNIEKKYELIDAVMRPRGFKRGNCGTNRVVYNFLEDTSFCMKIALDRVGINDSPREYKNQEFFKPFCCKIFEVDPTGVIACVERVNPISSLEEFVSIADDVFNMMVTKIIGKYVVDDLGTEKFMNYGIRYNSNGVAFGPVVLDYPYAYELDGAKLRCAKPIQIGNREFACGGEIDYDSGLNNLVCCKCGRHYSARELAKDDSNILKFYSDDDQCKMRARIVRETDGTIIKDSGRSSKIYMTKEEYEEGTKLFEVENFEPRRVEKTIKKKYTPMKKLREQYHTELQIKAYEESQKRNEELFNPVIKSEFSPRPAKAVSKKEERNNVSMNMPTDILDSKDIDYEIPRVRPARRAENLGHNIEEVLNEPKTEVVENIDKSSMHESNMITVKFESKPINNPKIEERAREFINNIKFSNEANDTGIGILRESIQSCMDTVEVDEPKIIKEAKIESFGLMPDGSIEPKFTGVEYESDNNKSDLSAAIVEAINECIKDPHAQIKDYHGLVHSDEMESGFENETFTEEMEADVFPEIANKGIFVNQNYCMVDKDYSDYEPPEYEDNYDDDYENESDHSEYYKENRKEKKRAKQKNKNKKFDDMSDY